MTRMLPAIVALTAAGAALQPPSAAAQTAAVSEAFRARTDLVEVEVIVQDRNGAFVGDLAIDDFELLDEGAPQRIQQLSVQQAGARDAPAAGETPRIFVVVFDEGHMTPAGFKRTQQAASAFFTEQLREGDLGGVVVNGRLVNDRITRDRSELIRAVLDARPSFVKASQQADERQWPRMTELEALRIVMNGDTAALDDVMRRACAEDPDQCRGLEDAVDEYVQSKALHIAEEARAQSLETLQVLRRLMDGLAGLGGSKSVLLMSEGFLADPTWPLVAETEQAAARARARIYSIDARGVDRNDDAGSRGSLSQLLQQMDAGEGSMSSLAADTGGFAVRNLAMLSTALTQIAADAQSYYVLGHRPFRLDGRFHELTVRVKRPDVSVRARRGYVASAAGAASASFPTVAPAPTMDDEARPVEGIDTAEREAVAPRANTGTLAPVAPDEHGIRMRPGAATHVQALGRGAPPDAAAAGGWEAFSRGELEVARAALAAAAAAPSARPWVPYALGHVEYARGDHAAAIAAWERVLAATGDFEPVYFDLADSYLQLEDLARATRLLQQASGRWPEDAEVFQSLGIVSAGSGSLDEAIGLFERALALAADNAAAHFNLGKALELRYYASRRYDEQARAWVAEEGDREKAAAAYRRCAELGGPFAAEAREGLVRLDWMAK
ncbi:MAG: VWA domain-containing protein [Acidobacteria bacterium]|nr:VWA domain-containing protein [Acidobacteriota bacterium]